MYYHKSSLDLLIYKKCFPFYRKKKKIYIGILDKETKKNEGERWFLANLSLKISKDNFCRFTLRIQSYGVGLCYSINVKGELGSYHSIVR